MYMLICLYIVICMSGYVKGTPFAGAAEALEPLPELVPSRRLRGRRQAATCPGQVAGRAPPGRLSRRLWSDGPALLHRGSCKMKRIWIHVFPLSSHAIQAPWWQVFVLRPCPRSRGAFFHCLDGPAHR